MRIKLTKHWDASLTYDVLKQALDAEAPPFVGRHELLGALVNAIEQPDRRGTYLVSGYRGAGKTSLVIEAARHARRGLQDQGWQLLPIVLNVSEVSASLSDASDAVAPPLQIDARRLLTALLRALRNNLRDPQGPGRNDRAVQKVEKTYRAAVVRDWIASRAKAGNGAAPLEDPGGYDDLVQKIDDAYRIASATQYVERSRQGTESSLRRVTESRLGISVPNALKLIAAVAVIVAAGLGASALVGPVLGIVAALAAAAVVAFSYSRTTSREAAETESAAVELVIDYSIHQLENDLKDILSHLQTKKLRTIVVLEELDKVDDSAGKQLDAVIRYFKNLFTQAPALFFFLTDKQYYDLVAKKIDEARRRRTYSVEHTFFTHRVFVNRPTVRECFEYLKTVACDPEEQAAIEQIMKADGDRVRDLSSMDLQERFLRLLLFRAQDHIFDLKNEMRRYVQVADGVSSLECDESSVSSSEQALATFQFLVEQKARAHAFHGGGEYANEVLRNCLFSVFTDSEVGDKVRVERFYPMERGKGDQVTASEDLRIREAVGSLVRDLQRGGVIRVEAQSGAVEWTSPAARFTPKAELEEHETALADKLNAHVKSLSVLVEGGALHHVVPSVGPPVDDLVRRLREEAARPEQSRTPLTVEQTTSAASILDGEVARIVTQAFDTHRSQLMTKYAWITSPIESGATGSAWRVAGVVRGAAAELGDVLLVYGAPELVRQAVTAFLASTVPTRRLAIVNVVLGSTESSWEPQRDAILEDWRSQLEQGLAERTLISVVPLDEGLAADDAAEHWTDVTADEVIVADAWVNQASGVQPEAPPPGEEIVSRSEGESTVSSFETAFHEWLGGSDPVLCWLTPPNAGVIQELFARPLLTKHSPIAPVPLPLVAIPADPGLSPPNVQAMYAAYARLAGAGRLVLVADDANASSFPFDHKLPDGARLVVPWFGEPDVRLSNVASAGVEGAAVTALRSAGERVPPVELARLVRWWDPEHARRLFESAAADRSAPAMRELALDASFRGDEAAAQSWREKLEGTGNWTELELLANELRPRDPVVASGLDEAAAEAGSPTAMVRLATDLFDDERETADKWVERLVETGNATEIERLADNVRDRDPVAARALDIAAADRGWPAAMYQLIVDFLEESPSMAESWQRRLLATNNTYWIGYAVNATVAADAALAATWASLALEAGEPDAVAAVADALDGIDEKLAKRLRDKLPPAP